MDYSTLKGSILNDVQKDKTLAASIGYFNKHRSYRSATVTAKSMGKAISNALVNHKGEIEENTLAEYAAQVLKPILDLGQKNMEKLCELAQTEAFKTAGIGLKAVSTAINVSRTNHIVDRFALAQDLADVAFLLEKGVVQNIMVSAVTDHMQASAEQLSEAGFETIVTRYDNGGCCSWCEERLGSYPLDSIPDDFWAVHNNCTCTFEYSSKLTGANDVIHFETDSEGKKHKVTVHR